MTSLRRCKLGNEGGWSLGREFPLKTATINQQQLKNITFDKVKDQQHNDAALVI